MDRVISDVDCADIKWHEWRDLPFIEIFNVISVPIVVTRANCTILGTLHEYFIHMLINHGSWFLTAGVGNGKTLSNPTLDMIQKLEFQGCNCGIMGFYIYAIVWMHIGSIQFNSTKRPSPSYALDHKWFCCFTLALAFIWPYLAHLFRMVWVNTLRHVDVYLCRRTWPSLVMEWRHLLSIKPLHESVTHICPQGT